MESKQDPGVVLEQRQETQYSAPLIAVDYASICHHTSSPSGGRQMGISDLSETVSSNLNAVRVHIVRTGLTLEHEALIALLCVAFPGQCKCQIIKIHLWPAAIS